MFASFSFNVVDSLKLQVAFAKEPHKRDDILQKSPVISRIKRSSGPLMFEFNGLICGGYDEQAPKNYRSLWQKSPMKKMMSCKRDL